MTRKIIIIFIVVVMTGGGYFLWSRKPADTNAMAGPSVRTATIKRGDLRAMVSATGKVEPIHQVEVKSKASGQIISMPVEESDRTRQGDLIAHIDETDLRNTYEQAMADLEVAKAMVVQTTSNANRQLELFKRGLLSQAEFDQVKLEEVSAKAQQIKAENALSLAKTRLQEAVVRSPINGLILQKNVEAGQIIASGINSVSGGTLIVTVANMDSVYVVAEVDEVDVGQVQIGQKAKVVADAFPDEVFDGSVLRIAPLATVQQNVTTFNVTVLVVNTDSKLKAGMNATVDLTVADRHEVLLVPKEAVKDFGDIRTQLAMLYGADTTAAPAGHSMPDSMRARWRARFANTEGSSHESEMLRPGHDGVFGNAQAQQKFVLVENDNRFVPRPVAIGASNFDNAEVVNGLQESETVMLFSSSRAAADRQRFMDRMRSMNNFSGFGGGQRIPGGAH